MSCSFYPKLPRAISRLVRGEVIAYPTEAVWGLGCDPFNETAISQVLALKRRPWQKGLILVAADIKQFDFILRGLDPSLLAKLEKTWPGHVTWLVPHRQRVSTLLSGEHNSIALRVSAHPLVRALCQAFDGPVVSTSANPQGLSPARTELDARRYFGSQVFYLSGRVGSSGSPSEIRDLISDKVIRA